MFNNHIIYSVFTRNGRCTTSIRNPSPRVHALMMNLCRSHRVDKDKDHLYKDHYDIGEVDKMSALFSALDLAA